MSVLNLISAACYLVGAFFFLAGTVGILRFPDVYARLHALTKADGLGLGFVVLGLSLEAPSVTVALKSWLTWALVLVGSSISCQLVARSAYSSGIEARELR